MLVAGKAERGKDDVDRFMWVSLTHTVHKPWSNEIKDFNRRNIKII